MNKRILFLSLLATSLLPACTTTPKYFDMNSAEFSAAKTDDLCVVYGFRLNRAEEAKAELIRRNTFTEPEWRMIEARKIAPGLSECGVKAAFPLNVAKYYFHNDANGKPVGKDMVFACEKTPAPHCPFTKVEIRDGKVSAVAPASEL